MEDPRALEINISSLIAISTAALLRRVLPWPLYKIPPLSTFLAIEEARTERYQEKLARIWLRQTDERPGYRVGLIAPRDIEYQAAIRIFEPDPPPATCWPRYGGLARFMVGYVGRCKVIMAGLSAGQPCDSSTVRVLAHTLKQNYGVQHALLVGTGVGLPDPTPQQYYSGIRVGDVLVGYRHAGGQGPIVAYRHANQRLTGYIHDGVPVTLETDPTMVRAMQWVHEEWRRGQRAAFNEKLQSIRENEPSLDWQETTPPDTLLATEGDDSSAIERPERTAENQTRIWYGAIASGDAVVNATRVRDRIRTRDGVIGVECGAIGAVHNLRAGVIRGVAGYGDNRDTRAWQGIAASAAAAYAALIIQHLFHIHDPAPPAYIDIF
ncbi:hypothetical protein BO70DRAFT_428709 [Aspergillus heteromorphus CBS 117.55]|uniref:Purine and uridine phosphorylase n=1 Tax=Aspergillus heteromorphus CBS 117.55 TaxID=1448321 RepID=A0A317WAM5_9EURO|nr:uncharacterized protein BO70DRAFT_428709 [Aspergillus heteromorphus CBS 117.55]PWY83403.1 hypothetical protein BO70DRAFT_428709 [Aspergillus heteromorphus CBS 117.55]